MNELLSVLIPLLISVETGGCADPNTAIGDNGNAVGCLQIWKICVDDTNRIVGKKQFSYEDRKNRKKSIQLAKIYLTHYGKYYTKKTGKPVTMEVLARNWNGNPVNGYKNPKTLKYWLKVKKQLQKGK